MKFSVVLIFFQSHKKAGAMWREAGLEWKDYLPEDVDVNKFVTEKVNPAKKTKTLWFPLVILVMGHS